MPRILDKIRELRLRYGPLVRLLERSSSFRKLLEDRPILMPLLESLKPAPLSAEEFIQDFQREVTNVKSGTQVVIYSPYLSEKGIENYVGVLRSAAKKGVEIIIHTLTPEHWSIREKSKHATLIKKLKKDIKAEIIERKNMHEKAVIITGENIKVAYFGSLNVLSKYEGKADYMLKFTHPEVVDALHLFLETLALESEKPKEE